MKVSKWIAMLAVCAVMATTAGCVVGFNSTDSSSNDIKESWLSESVDEQEDSILQDTGYSSENDEVDFSADSASTEDSSFEEETPEEEPEDEVEKDYIYRMKADNKYVAIDVQNGISTRVGQMSFITKTSYRGIKRIAFNAKSGDIASWWGIAIADDAQTANVYNTDLIVGSVTTKDQWTTFVYDFSGTGCVIYATQSGYNPRVFTELKQVPYSEDGAYYIHFVGPLWETFSQPICLDNFTIELMDGTIYTDDFDEGTNQGLFNADKAVSHIVDASGESVFLEEEETPMYETNEVFYESEDRIDFTAYAPVTVENWGGSWTSNPNLVTEEQYRYMAEAGFTKSLGLYEGRTGNSGLTANEKAEKDALAVLKVAEKYGIQYYVLNEKFYNFVRPDINIEFFDLTKVDGKYYNNQGVEVSSYDSYKKQDNSTNSIKIIKA